MTTHHVVLHAKLVVDKLAFDQLTAAQPATLTLTGTNAYQVTFPYTDRVDIRIAGFSVGGQTYTISAISQVEGQPDASWMKSNTDALSPVFTVAADAVIKVTATSNNAATPRKLSTVSVKIKPSGKPDDFLGQFTPT